MNEVYKPKALCEITILQRERERFNNIKSKINVLFNM